MNAEIIDLKAKIKVLVEEQDGYKTQITSQSSEIEYKKILMVINYLNILKPYYIYYLI